MPPLSVWMLRLSLACLLVGAGAGSLLLSGVTGGGAADPLRSAHLDLMLFGWLVQFVIGVAYWILPRHAGGPERGSLVLAWTAFWMFQAGMASALAGAAGLAPGPAMPLGRGLVVIGTLLFVALLAPRARPSGAN
jgi:hypothetical protein